MEDIFISYSKNDLKDAKNLANKLNSFGLSVWWDNLLNPGDFFNEILTDKVSGSKVILVLWTENSIKSKWVHAEAAMALNQGKLIPVKTHRFDSEKIPLPFNTLHTIDITDSKGLIHFVIKKLELDERRQKEINNKFMRQKIFLYVGLTITLLFLFAFIFAFMLFPPFQRSFKLAVESVRAYVYPCNGLNVHIGNTHEVRRECVSEKEFENFTFRDCDSCPQMVVLPRGNLIIGSPKTENGRDLDEEPQILISLKAFAIGQFEITNAQWQACVLSEMCQPRIEHAQIIKDSHPINYISWNDAQNYANWLSDTTGKAYRLPTEAEWEYAARAGSDTPYYWGFNSSEACKYANVGDVSYGLTKNEDELSIPQRLERRVKLGGQHKCEDNYARLAPVGTFRPNQFQLYDTIGNVWEWVEDCAFPNYESIPNDGRPYKEEGCKVGMLRGGSYVSGPDSVRSANRFQGGRNRTHIQSDFGFRIVRDLP